MEIASTELPYPWFERAVYEKARRVMDDADYWPDDYETWHHFAKDAMARLATDGVTVVRQPIDPEHFLRWCREHDRPADSYARLMFAADQWNEGARDT